MRFLLLMGLMLAFQSVEAAIVTNKTSSGSVIIRESDGRAIKVQFYGRPAGIEATNDNAEALCRGVVGPSSKLKQIKETIIYKMGPILVSVGSVTLQYTGEPTHEGQPWVITKADEIKNGMLKVVECNN